MTEDATKDIAAALLAEARRLMVPYRQYRRHRYMCAACGAGRGMSEGELTITKAFPIILIDRRSKWTKGGNRLYRGAKPLRFCGYACFLDFARGFLLQNRAALLTIAHHFPGNRGHPFTTGYNMRHDTCVTCGGKASESIHAGF